MTAVDTILLPTDFSRCADKAFQAACSVARDRGSALVVLHVREPVTAPAPWLAVPLLGPRRRDCWAALRRLAAREPDLRVESALRTGPPAPAILALAHDTPCDLIVLGMRGRGGPGRSGLGRVAAQVTRLAPCPVLTVRPSPGDAGHPAADRPRGGPRERGAPRATAVPARAENQNRGAAP